MSGLDKNDFTWRVSEWLYLQGAEFGKKVGTHGTNDKDDDMDKVKALKL